LSEDKGDLFSLLFGVLCCEIRIALRKFFAYLWIGEHQRGVDRGLGCGFHFLDDVAGEHIGVVAEIRTDDLGIETVQRPKRRKNAGRAELGLGDRRRLGRVVKGLLSEDIRG
jgi:hypothetical protein